MARLLGRLTELQVRKLGRGWHNDGGGLYLRVEDRERRWWVYRYGAGGNRYHGLGPVHTVSLAEAREQARRCRALLLRAEDPIAAGRARRAAIKLAEATAKTFRECAEAYHAAHCAGWSNQKHAREWLASLTTHVFPAIGALAVSDVDTPAVLRVLQPAWTKIPETATRLRSRVESVLDFAKVSGLRDGENPARWRGHLDHLLPPRRKLARVKHHAALPYGELPALMRKLHAREDAEARALEFVILTAARAGEAVGADWDEISIEAGGTWTWTVPAARMKMRRPHRVPLSKAARAVLEQAPSDRRQGLIFPAVTVHKLWKFLRALTADATVHGLRSSFRDWAAEQTSSAREIAEMALAHRVGDDTEEAYRRTDLLKKRRALMEAWARHCTSAPAKTPPT
jgi:integrase